MTAVAAGNAPSRTSTVSGGPPSRSPGVATQNDPLWYKDAVIYEVRTRSYYDSNNDGIGDLKGLAMKLDYLADLGVTALWLLPHYPSPGRDDGYDISDYTDIHADIGTLEDFDELVAEAHRRNIRIITELVMNHTSDQHPWFQRARRAPPGSPERDFYVWSDTPDKYKEARIIFRDFEPSNWSWDPVAKSYFWHRFFGHQPDLNFDNPAVHEAMFGVIDFWMSRGVDGLRLDAVPYLYEREGTNCENLKETHAFLKKLRTYVDQKFPGRMLLAEANQWPEDAAAYFGNGDECHMNFHFPIMPRLFMSMHMEDRFPIIDILRQTPEVDPSCQWAMFLRNHDELTLEMVTDEERDYMYRVYAHEAQMRINLGIRRRLAPLVGNDRRRMELLNGLLFSMPGTPVLYYGDEIGMGDNVYLGDRNGVRTPMQWSADRNAGFSRANPQKMILPIIIDPEYHYEALNVEMQQLNSNSLLWWTKRIIALRKQFQAFGRGSVEFLHPSNPRVLAFVRRFENENILVVANLSRHTQFVELDLSSMKGMIPIELMGRTKFPPIGDLPYLLTLGGYAFYWFSLEPSKKALEEQRVSLLGPVQIACSTTDALLFGSERARLEEVLAGYLEGRGWTSGTVTAAQITETVRIPREGTEAPLVLAFVRVEYSEGEPDSFSLPLLVASGEAPAPVGISPGAVVAQLRLQSAVEGQATFIVEAPPEVAARALLDHVASKGSVKALGGKVVGASASAQDAVEGGEGKEAYLVRADRLGAAVAFGQSMVVKLYYRMEEGTAPELEVARHLESRGVTGLVPHVLGSVDYRVSRNEPVTLAVVEAFVVNEGTAWLQARGEIGRAYERMLTRPDEEPIVVPRDPLLELAYQEPPPAHAELIGHYRDWARRLGERTAELHLAFSASTDPAFEPTPYSAMDQRSKYQTARNLIGRVLGSMRRSLSDVPADARLLAEQVLENEDRVMAKFEPLLTQRLDALQIRHHGDLHLGRALFTGKDFVILDVGGARERRLAARRRRGSAFRDVAGVIRSYHYAAATSLRTLRPEDQARAEAWGWAFQRWASAAFVRGYMDMAKDAPFIPKSKATASMLLETATIEKAFAELRVELGRNPENVWIPLQGILRLLGVQSVK
ncbi:MAG: Trehalose synthase [Labilithrix sp.]|nr:Trehalose synthase [Labilithrix sp.]